MSVIETVIVYGVVPLVVFLLLALATLVPGRGKQQTKYRPGQPWTAAPVWWEPHPETSAGASHGSDHGDAHADGHHAPALGATVARLAIGQAPHVPEPARRTAAGGARGTW